MKRTTENNGTASEKRNCKGFLNGINIYILQTAIGSPRCKLFRSQIEKFGGKITAVVTNDTNYIIVEDSQTWDKICELLKWDTGKQLFEQLKVVKTAWLSMCLQEKRVVKTLEYEIFGEPIGNDHSSKVTNEERNAANDSTTFGSKHGESSKNYSAERSQNRASQEEAQSSQTVVRKHLQGRWVCAHPSSEKSVNLNEHITEKLQILADTYKNTQDHWRALTYQRAVTALKNFPTEITTREEAKSIPGVGDSLADKIWEIIVNGSLRKIEAFSADDELKAIGLFTQIWGAGPATAESWVKQGFRTLEDLKNRAKLTRHQQIGLKYFDDVLEKMPRDEAAHIIETVTVAAHCIDPALEVIGCGSYRRLKSSCGDVDVLITHPDGNSHILTPLVASLHESGFLTDDLVGSAEMGADSKYMGICKLPGDGRKHRRIDIFVVPRHEYACALLAYTGSGHFNRSMRLLARKKGMALSHHSLNDGVIRNGAEKLHDGRAVPTPTEQSIFEYLGLEYRPPEERDH